MQTDFLRDSLDTTRPESAEDLTRLCNPRPVDQQPVSNGSTNVNESSIAVIGEMHEDDNPAIELTQDGPTMELTQDDAVSPIQVEILAADARLPSSAT